MTGPDQAPPWDAVGDAPSAFRPVADVVTPHYRAIHVRADAVPLLAEFIEHYAPLDRASERLLDVARALRVVEADAAGGAS